jgi:hypothetical protein
LHSERKPGTTRRGLLRACLAGALAGPVSAQARSKVAIALNPDGAIDSARLLRLLDRAVQSVCDADSPLEAWKKIVRPGEVVALKNFFGAVHNPSKYHSNAGDPYVAGVYMLPPIRAKVRLHICDALAPQYEGGPSYMPHWSWPFRGLFASRDPVALDYTGWQIIERKRAEKGLPTLRALRREPTYIARAADARRRLGTNDPGLIDKMEI